LNLIVTCARNLEEDAGNEIESILDNLGDSEPSITITNMPGILTIETMIEPTNIVAKIREMILDEPWSIRYCLRVIPIQKTIKTDIENIKKIIPEMIVSIGIDDTYRVLVENRNSNISTQELISETAKLVKNKVSLDTPDWVILLEIIGDTTGISVIKNNDIVSVEKIKRSLSE
jgi:tRNA acetyltransferase TAN1